MEEQQRVLELLCLPLVANGGYVTHSHVKCPNTLFHLCELIRLQLPIIISVPHLEQSATRIEPGKATVAQYRAEETP